MNLPIKILTPEEMAAAHAEVIDLNERKERARVAGENRARGFPEPQPGDRLYVTSGRGLRQRTRAGIAFNDLAPTEVVVVGELDDRPPNSVTVSGAELILNDTALNVRGRNATDVEVSDLRRQVADRDAELATLRAENARILREARMASKDPGDGSPARLQAARKARAGLPDEGGFGGKE